MPKFAIERQYLMPVYQHLTIEADTLEEACQKAMVEVGWEDATQDYDNARSTTITQAKKLPEDFSGLLGEYIYDQMTAEPDLEIPKEFLVDE